MWHSCCICVAFEWRLNGVCGGKCYIAGGNATFGGAWWRGMPLFSGVLRFFFAFAYIDLLSVGICGLYGPLLGLFAVITTWLNNTWTILLGAYRPFYLPLLKLPHLTLFLPLHFSREFLILVFWCYFSCYFSCYKFTQFNTLKWGIMSFYPHVLAEKRGISGG